MKMANTLFMIREHPSIDLVMIQIDNNAIQLDHEDQKKVYKYLKEKMEK